MLIERWLTDAELAAVEYSDYWNDPDEERRKIAYWIVDGDFSKVDAEIASKRLRDDIERCAKALARRGRPIAGVGLDLAAGALWAAPILFSLGPIANLVCVEISRHRLLTLGPPILDHYKVPKDRVTLALGSFYDVKVPAASVDFVLLNQAFHHAAEPMRLLGEVRRVLRYGGVVIIVGEHRRTPPIDRQVVHAVRYLAGALPAPIQKIIRGRMLNRPATLLPCGADLFPPDDQLGDHFYLPRDYRRMFRESGFRGWPVPATLDRFMSFVLAKA